MYMPASAKVCMQSSWSAEGSTWYTRMELVPIDCMSSESSLHCVLSTSGSSGTSWYAIPAEVSVGRAGRVQLGAPLTKNWSPPSVKNLDPLTEMVSMAPTAVTTAAANSAERMAKIQMDRLLSGSLGNLRDKLGTKQAANQRRKENTVRNRRAKVLQWHDQVASEAVTLSEE
jgi:hypothetical protein